MLIALFGPLGYETALRLYEENKEKVRERFPRFFIEQFTDISGGRFTDISSGDFTNIAGGEFTDISGGRFADIPGGETEPARVAARFSAEGEGGLYKALWEMGSFFGCGMEIDLEAISVRQEVIEILELFGESPYECSSSGCFVSVVEEKDSRRREEAPGPGCGICNSEEEGRTAKAILPLRKEDGFAGFAISAGSLRVLTCEGEGRIIGRTVRGNDRVIVSREGRRFLTPPSRQMKDTEDRRRRAQIPASSIRRLHR